MDARAPAFHTLERQTDSLVEKIWKSNGQFFSIIDRYAVNLTDNYGCISIGISSSKQIWVKQNQDLGARSVVINKKISQVR